MKKYLKSKRDLTIHAFIVAFCMLITIQVKGQNRLDSSLQKISSEIASKLSKRGIKKIVILYVKDEAKKQTQAGRYMADMMSFHMVNDTSMMQIFNRENLESIIEMKKLIDDGFIDQSRAQEVGKLLAVDAVVTGVYTKFEDYIKLYFQAFDTKAGFLIAATALDCKVDESNSRFLGYEKTASGQIQPQQQSTAPEAVETPKPSLSLDQETCMAQNIGDCWVQNNTKRRMVVTIYLPRKNEPNLSYEYITTLVPIVHPIIDDYPGFAYQTLVSWAQTISIEPGEKQAFYNIKAGAYSVVAYDSDEYNAGIQEAVYLHSSMRKRIFTKALTTRIEKCRSVAVVLGN